MAFPLQTIYNHSFQPLWKVKKKKLRSFQLLWKAPPKKTKTPKPQNPLKKFIFKNGKNVEMKMFIVIGEVLHG